VSGARFCRDFACRCLGADRLGRTLEAIAPRLTETANVLPKKTLIATTTAAGLMGLGAAALLAPGPASTPSTASAPAAAPDVRTQVVTQVIHRVRHVTDPPRRSSPAVAPPQPAAVPVADPAPIAAPVRTRASGAGEEREDEHAEREDEHAERDDDAFEHAEESDD
jgi:hypothetical protein